jgi:hypothetical protein
VPVQPDRAGADHGKAPGEIRQFEHGFAGDRDIAQGGEGIRQHGRRPVGDDDRPRLDDPTGIEQQPVRPGKTRPCPDGYAIGQALDRFARQRGEAIPLRAHPAEDGGAVDPRSVDVDPEQPGPPDPMGLPCSCDEQLGRHATDRGAGRAGKCGIDQHRRRAVLARARSAARPAVPAPMIATSYRSGPAAMLSRS